MEEEAKNSGSPKAHEYSSSVSRNPSAAETQQEAIDEEEELLKRIRNYWSNDRNSSSTALMNSLSFGSPELSNGEELFEVMDFGIGIGIRMNSSSYRNSREEEAIAFMNSISFGSPEKSFIPKPSNGNSASFGGIGNMEEWITGVQKQEFEGLGISSGIETGKQNINNGSHQEERLVYLGPSSSSSVPKYSGLGEVELERYKSLFNGYNMMSTRSQVPINPTTTSTSYNGGTFPNSQCHPVGNYYYSNSNSMNYGIDQVPNSVSRQTNGYNGYPLNHQTYDDYRLEDQHTFDRRSPSIRTLSRSSSLDFGSNCCSDEVLHLNYLTINLMELNGWEFEKVLKVVKVDPSLLDEIRPYDIFILAKLKKGSLYLQGVLNDGNSLYFAKIFYVALEFIYPLMTDPEGNFVIQALFGMCDSLQMRHMVEKIITNRNELKYAGRNEYGSKTLIKLIIELRRVSPLLSKHMLSALSVEFPNLIKSKPGSYLIKFCLKYLDPNHYQSLYKVAAEHSLDLATHEYGYSSLISLIENKRYPDNLDLLLSISIQALYLSQHPYGNYVVQSVLNLEILEINEVICRNLGGNYVSLSMHQCGSHVVEKCIESNGMDCPLLELIYSNKLHLLSQDSMGNYVVQKALKVTQLHRQDLYTSLVNAIHPHMKLLQHHPVGRNVYKAINKRRF